MAELSDKLVGEIKKRELKVEDFVGVLHKAYANASDEYINNITSTYNDGPADASYSAVNEILNCMENTKDIGLKVHLKEDKEGKLAEQYGIELPEEYKCSKNLVFCGVEPDKEFNEILANDQFNGFHYSRIILYMQDKKTEELENENSEGEKLRLIKVADGGDKNKAKVLRILGLADDGNVCAGVYEKIAA